MHTVLILGGGQTQLDAIASARKLGLRVVVADGNPQAPGMLLDDELVLPLEISFRDVDGVVQALRERLIEIDAVLPYGSDFSVLPAAQIARHLDLASIGTEAAQACTDKVLMRQRWKKAGIPTLPYSVIETVPEADREAATIGFPVVVKPPDNAAQRGVQLVNDPSSLHQAVREAFRHSPTNRVLIEKFIDGPELAATTFAANGRTATIQITDRVTGPPPYLGICLAHVFPSMLDHEMLRSVEELMPAAAEALGVSRGPTYSQIRIYEGVPYVLETGARLGGGRDSELRELLSQQDAIAVHIRQLLGEPVHLEELSKEELKGAGCVRFLTGNSGQLEAIQGVEDAMALEGVRSVAMFYKVGQRVPPLQDGAARVGYLIATGENREVAIQRAQNAAQQIEFDFGAV